jgi:HSP20 family protein
LKSLFWEDFPEWFRRRFKRSPFFSSWFFEDIDKMMEEMFKEIQEFIPKELIKEEKLPSGGVIRRIGPIVYGYSMSIGPDGKPVIREFGNVKPSMKPTAFGFPKPGLEVKVEREPLVDTIEEEENVKVIAEVPGVEKEDINLECTESSLIISVDTPTRKYYKEVELPAEVDPQSAKASYKNGVLEVTLTKKKAKPKGQKVKIE